MSIIRSLAALFVGFALAFNPVVAEAATKAEIKEQQAHVKDLKKGLKSFQKNAAKWSKAKTKGKSTSKIDAELEAFAKAELNWLRQSGMPTKAAEGQAEENPWMARYRDALVGMRDTNKPVEKEKHFEQIENSLKTRLDRQQRQLQQMGG